MGRNRIELLVLQAQYNLQLNSELATIEANKNRVSNLDMMLMYLFSSVSRLLGIWCTL